MWIKVVGTLVLVLAALAAFALSVGTARWTAATRDLRARLEQERAAPAVARFDPAELADLPAPVRRHLERALTPGQPVVTAVSVEHRGTFDLGGDGTPRWVPFTSRQRVTTARPGFDWDARVRMAPAVRVHVRDAYVAGRGRLEAAIGGLVRVMREPPSAELDRGEFLRFAAEAAWYPTALLPSQGARWVPVDDRTAELTLADGAVTATLTVRFGDDGLLESVRAAERTRVADGVRTVMAWSGRFWAYERREGMLVPLEGEVSWLPPARAPMPYWRGRIERVAYEFASDRYPSDTAARDRPSPTP